MEKMLKQIEMGFDPQKSFTKMNKNRDMKDGIWGQVMYLNPPVMQKTSEEICGDSEAAKNMRVKNNRFVITLMRNRFAHGFSSMDYLPGLEKVFLYKT